MDLRKATDDLKHSFEGVVHTLRNPSTASTYTPAETLALCIPVLQFAVVLKLILRDNFGIDVEGMDASDLAKLADDKTRDMPGA